MIGDWLLIATVVAVVWTLWMFGNYVADLFTSHRQVDALRRQIRNDLVQAAPKQDGEDSTAAIGTGSSL